MMNSRNGLRFRCHSRGQAFSESLAAVLFLVPLMLSMIYLATLMQAEQTAVLTARELAFAALHSADGQVTPEIISRLQVLLTSEEGASAENLDAEVTATEIGAVPLLIEQTAMTLLTPAEVVGVGSFDLPSVRAARASVVVSVAADSALDLPIDQPISLREGISFFAGHGAASGPEQVRARTASLSVASVLAEIAQPLEAVADVASVLEPALRMLCIGRIDPEIVPADRLPADITRTSDLRYQSC